MSLLDIIGSIIGLAYIVSEYRADRWFWPLSLLMSVFYAVIYFVQIHAFANGMICVYNMVMSVYGIMVWRGYVQSKDKQERRITSCPKQYWLLIVVGVVVVTLLLHWCLATLGERLYDSVSVELEYWLDSVTSGLTIVAMWMLSQKWWQQWFLWMIVEPLMIVLFLLSGYYASAVLYGVFEVFCVLGVIRWRKESREQ